MISIAKYLNQESDTPKSRPEDGQPAVTQPEVRQAEEGLFAELIRAYRSALGTMGRASLEACPRSSGELMRGLGEVGDSIAEEVTSITVKAAVESVRAHLMAWGRNTAQYYEQKTDEVKQILTVMARTAESAVQRDESCASRFTEVTHKLTEIVSLDDLGQIRTSIESCAAELANSIERMTAEGRSATDRLLAELQVHQSQLAEANQMALTDSLTGLRNRLWMENYIAQHIDEGRAFCVLVVDIDKFKSVNDTHGHLAGDEVLQQFSAELRMAFRSGDAVSRWGGDEFLLLLDCDADQARTQIERLRRWAYGEYTVKGRSGRVRLTVEASVGLGEYRALDTMQSLLERADADMYREKEIAQAVRMQAVCAYAA